MVIAPVSTRSDRNVVIGMDHTKKGDLCTIIPSPCMLEIVVIKLIEPKMDEILDRWRLEIVESTASLEWLVIPLKDR